MKSFPCSHFKLVKILTLTLVLALSACSYFRRAQREFNGTCTNHAYTQLNLEDYLTRRFHSKAPVRLGVVPFSVPANFASRGVESPGIDMKLAWQVQSKLLAGGIVPIVEIFNRLDWPGKKDEFFTGNFGALSFAREAGYDMVLVGYVQPINSLQSMTVQTKVIEVESGITVWYGESIVTPYDPNFERSNKWWWFGETRPDILNLDLTLNDLSNCIVQGIEGEEDLPNY